MSKTTDFLPPKKEKKHTLSVRVGDSLYRDLLLLLGPAGILCGLSLGGVGKLALTKLVADLKAEKRKKS